MACNELSGSSNCQNNYGQGIYVSSQNSDNPLVIGDQSFLVNLGDDETGNLYGPNLAMTLNAAKGTAAGSNIALLANVAKNLYGANVAIFNFPDCRMFGLNIGALNGGVDRRTGGCFEKAQMVGGNVGIANAFPNIIGGNIALVNAGRESLIGGNIAFVNHSTRGTVVGGNVGVFYNHAAHTMIGGNIAVFVNDSGGDMIGGNISLVGNFANGELVGANVGAINISKNMTGGGVGIVNIAEETMSGFQVGIVNIADKMDWVQLGAVNVWKEEGETCWCPISDLICLPWFD